MQLQLPDARDFEVHGRGSVCVGILIRGGLMKYPWVRRCNIDLWPSKPLKNDKKTQDNRRNYHEIRGTLQQIR